MLWVAQKKALELYFRLRYSAQESDTARYSFQQQKYVKKSLDPTEIALEISHATMKRPQKIQNRKNQPLDFSKNQKLLKSTHGARRTVIPKYLDVLGGSLRILSKPIEESELNFVRRLTCVQQAGVRTRLGLSRHSLREMAPIWLVSEVGFSRICNNSRPLGRLGIRLDH